MLTSMHNSSKPGAYATPQAQQTIQHQSGTLMDLKISIDNTTSHQLRKALSLTQSRIFSHANSDFYNEQEKRANATSPASISENVYGSSSKCFTTKSSPEPCGAVVTDSLPFDDQTKSKSNTAAKNDPGK
mmetsp:Transcript_37992/g.88390  ORF Transcript_37992/g.88390 Transcript_37992/m.88390 type:complete len:130 (+) Transcript_37992:84-473(+)